MATFPLIILLQVGGSNNDSLIYSGIFIGAIVLFLHFYNRKDNEPPLPSQSNNPEIEKQIQLKNLEIEKLKLEMSLKSETQQPITQPVNQENTIKPIKNFGALVIGCVLLILTIGGFAYFWRGGGDSNGMQSPDEFKQWITGKHFTSIGNDLEQTDLQGNLHSPVGSLELAFGTNTMTYQNCSAESYSVYQDSNGSWVAQFKKCGSGDDFELVIPKSGDYFVRSIDYDVSKMEQSATSAINRLDAIASKKVERGPLMRISN